MLKENRVGIFININSMGEGWKDQLATAEAFAKHLKTVLMSLGYQDVHTAIGLGRSYIYVENGTHTEEEALRVTKDETWAEWITSPESIRYAAT